MIASEHFSYSFFLIAPSDSCKFRAQINVLQDEESVVTTTFEASGTSLYSESQDVYEGFKGELLFTIPTES